MSALEIFVSQHALIAYFVLFAAMFIDGEAPFLAAAILAWQGYLNWWAIIMVAFAGVVLGDAAWYFLGRNLDQVPFFGFLFKIKFSAYQEWLENNFLKRYRTMAFFSKFIYGLNRLTPIIAGWHKFEFGKFFKIHFAAAVLWVTANAVFGYSLGLAIGEEGLRQILKRFEVFVLAAFILFIGGEYILKKMFAKKIKKQLGR